jgi:hypothetical protein
MSRHSGQLAAGPRLGATLYRLFLRELVEEIRHADLSLDLIGCNSTIIAPGNEQCMPWRRARELGWIA